MKNCMLSLCLLLVCFAAGAANPDIELIRKRFAESALRPASSVNIDRVKQRMSTISADGSWPDINYEDTRNVAFQNAEHLSHMVEMARAYKLQSSPLKGNRELRDKLFSAIDFWTRNDFICENWWNNEIGTPTQMISLLYIMDKELGRDREEKMTAIALRANLRASGARPSGDRMKIADLYAQIRLYQRDIPEVEKMLTFICEEMRYYDQKTFDRIMWDNPQYLGGGKGLQADFSFHHRMDRVNNTLSYGSGFASAFMDWAPKVIDTRYRFGDEYVRLMVDFYLDGMVKQMAFGIQSDPGVMNRDIARPSTGKQLGSNSIPQALLSITDYRRDELQAVLDVRAGKDAEVQSFAKTFFNSEYFVFQRPSYFTSVRMYSTRNASMEVPYNGEGFTNHYRADGANYLTVTGDEYVSIYPAFDFRKVPGTTVLQAGAMPPEEKVQQMGLTDFVGGVDDGLYGAAAFDFISPIDVVSGKKAWFFFDDAYLCLGAKIAHKGPGEVVTTLNQCFLKGNVEFSSAGVDGVFHGGDYELDACRWVNHDNVGYIFPKQFTGVVSTRTMEGSWTRLNRQTTVSDKPVMEDIFTLFIEHGSDISDSEYQYIVLPGADAARTDAYSRDCDIKVLSNTENLQAAVNAAQGVAYAVFYSGGELKVDDGLSVSSDSPAMVLLRFGSEGVTELVVSDPSRKSTKLHIGLTQSGRRTGYAVEMPCGELGGSSVEVKLD